MRHAINHLRQSDPTLCAIINRVGPFRMQYREPTFEALVRSIAFQQLNGKAARSIFDRLVAAAGGIITPESILKLSTRQMRAVGLSKQKLSYIRDLAQRTHSGEIDFAALSPLSDEDVIATLTKVKGIGEWTAHMFLIFALQRPNVLPTGDYGVRAAIKRAYRKRKLPTPAVMEKLAKSWHPYCSVAAWYLWRSMDGKIEI
jgi:3-methyladenine DNA glycosylase/8-oxoguanine DNA glycosylase